MFKFGRLEVASKIFHTTQQLTDIYNINIDKITVSDAMLSNKGKDKRCIIGYEVEPQKIIPLHIKTPKNCNSNGVSRFNSNAAWKMGFDVSEDPEWIKRYKAILNKIEELIFQTLTSTPLNNEKYINPKLLTWNDEIKTVFNGWGVPFDKYCNATGVLKISSVYQQGLNHYIQVFLKECKWHEKTSECKSQASLLQ